MRPSVLRQVIRSVLSWHYMKERHSIVVATAGVIMIAGIVPAFSQVPHQFQINPHELISSLTFALQSGDKPLLEQWLQPDLLSSIIRATDGNGLDTRLRDLGPVIQTDVSDWETTDIGRFFSAKVTHRNGMVSWSVALNPASQRVQSVDFQIFASNTTSTSQSEPRLKLRGAAKNRELSFGVGAAPADACGHDPISCSSTTAATKPWAFDPRIVDFLFATTRKPVAGATDQFTGERAADLTYGAVSVRVPEDHKIGRIELHSSWKMWGISFGEGGSDDRKHFSVRNVSVLSRDQWSEAIRSNGEKKALIFVHGFNNTFEDSVFRNAQIIWDLQYSGLAILFSWASAGRVGDYFYDQQSAYLARSAFLTLVRELKETYGVERVDVLAHSMGNLVVLDALSGYAKTTNPVQIGELVMAAPDVDKDVFLALVPDVRKIAKGMTLYVSSADRALAASRIPARAPRAGDVPPGGPIVAKGIETIDVTAVGDDILGFNHNGFASNRAIIDDIKLVLSTGLRPPNRRLSEIRAIPELPFEPKYWRYAR